VSWQGLSALAAAGVALAVAALVVLLYLLKPASRKLVVPSMVIWRVVLRTRKPTPDRLRWWLSLLLALLIALSLTLALVRPQLAVFGGATQSAVLVIDNSATMGAIASDGKTRFQHGLERARELVQAGGEARFMVADTRRQIASPRFESREAALLALQRLHVMPGGKPQFPSILGSHERDVRAVLITDGVAAIDAPSGVQTLSVYQIADNVGITAFEVRPLPRDAQRYQAYVEIFNGSPGGKQVRLQVTGAGGAPIQRTLQLAGGAHAAEVLDVSAYASGPIRAAVDAAYDALPLDDVAFSYLPPSKPIRVVLVSRGNLALERSLRLLPRVQLSVIPPGKYAPRSAVDVWVFDRFAPRDAPASAALLFRPSPADWLPRAGGELRETNVAAWSAAHPVTDSVSLRDVLAERALHIREAARAQVLASDPGRRPLILASASGPRWVEVAFALEDSNLSLQAGFPAFLSNALNWMTGEPLAMQAGLGLIELPVVRAKVLDLQGQPVRSRELPEATLVESLQPTFYTAIASDRRVRVAVSVLDPAVSALNRTALAGAAPAKPAAGASAALLPSPWLALLILVAVLLLFEWWTYNRRLTI
jgi:Ca-activated chloride channel family protein